MKLIKLLKYLFLSIIQGIGEILPISSSGHLILFERILKIESNGVSLEIFLHLASLLALIIFYYKEIISLVKGIYKYNIKKEMIYYKDHHFFLGMIVSLIPVVIIGYFFNDYLDEFFNKDYLIGIFLILNGINLFSIRKLNGYKTLEDLNYFSFFKIGLGQCIGLIPGISRSGSSLSMCYREKLNKDESTKLTFMLLFPLIIGSFILNINEFNFAKEDLLLLIISFITTFIVTLISLNFLKKIIKSDKFQYFAFYCVIIGIVLVVI